jgi:putative oxidoreductase
MSIDIGLLLLRVITGVLLAGHGMQKISYRFGGNGLRGGIEEFRSDGFRGGALTALAAGLGQLGSGLFLAAGLATPAAATAAIGVMTVAATVKARNGLWVQHDGYEFPLVLITITSALAFTGAGTYSVDALLGLDHPAPWIGLGATAVGVGAGLTARLVLHTPTTPRTES